MLYQMRMFDKSNKTNDSNFNSIIEDLCNFQSDNIFSDKDIESMYNLLHNGLVKLIGSEEYIDQCKLYIPKYQKHHNNSWLALKNDFKNTFFELIDRNNFDVFKRKIDELGFIAVLDASSKVVRVYNNNDDLLLYVDYDEDLEPGYVSKPAFKELSAYYQLKIESAIKDTDFSFLAKLK